MRIVQLSDPHLVASPSGLVRQRPALRHWQKGLEEAMHHQPDLLLISGDCCHDESWNGYAVLRDSLTALPAGTSVAIVPGNHDHPQRLRAALGRSASIGPAALNLGPWDVVLLSSHTSGRTDGILGTKQLRWLSAVLQAAEEAKRPVLIGMHHPPVQVGQPAWDRIGLRDAEALHQILHPIKNLRAVVVGHLHQHWQGSLPERPDVPVLACPSTLCAFDALQPCPQGRSQDPGGRLIEVDEQGSMMTTVLRWLEP